MKAPPHLLPNFIKKGVQNINAAKYKTIIREGIKNYMAAKHHPITHGIPWLLEKEMQPKISK